jgi:uncharacterized protein YycO
VKTPRADFDRYGPGEQALEPRPGDIVFTHRRGLIPRLIRLAERRHCGSAAYWSHCAIVVDADGTLVEAESRGVVRSPLSKYRPREYTLVRTSGLLGDAGSREAVAYATVRVGEAFGFLVMLSLAIWLLTGVRVGFRRKDHQICSGLVAGALQSGGLDVGGDPSFLLPCDLAERFSALRPGASGAGTT